jgi:biotin carboxylase
MKILLLDTNVSAYPIYEYLLTLKHEVFVAGSNPNDCLALCCPNFLNLDYSCIENIENASQKFGFDYVLPGCNDVSYSAASLYNEKYQKGLNIDPPDISNIINEKGRFKQFALEKGLKVPRPLTKEELIGSAKKKVIVKPVDAFSGRGISVLSSDQLDMIDEAITLAENFSSTKKFLIEEFVDGQLYSHSAFILNGKINIDFIVEEHCITNPYAVDTSWVIQNEDFPLIADIRSEIELLSRELNLCDGLVHTQFIKDGNELRILEVTRRCPGDLYSKLIEYSSGYDYACKYISMILNEYSEQAIQPFKRRVLRHTVTFNKPQKFISLRLNIQSAFMEFVPLAITGSLLTIAPKGRAGILFLSCSNEYELNQVKDTITKNELLIN